MDCVVVVQSPCGEHEAEHGAKGEADEIHWALHFATAGAMSPRAVNDVSKNVTATAVAMKVAVDAQLAGERWAVPHMPWPEQLFGHSVYTSSSSCDSPK